MEYKPCDRIFAKVKGFPHWPARINVLPEDVTIPKAPKDICLYERWKHKYAVTKNRFLFQKGLEEIENEPNILLYGKDANAEQFLLQFYKFKVPTSSSKPPLTEELSTPEVPAVHASAKGIAKTSDLCSKRPTGPRTIKRSTVQLLGSPAAMLPDVRSIDVSDGTERPAVDKSNDGEQGSVPHAENGRVDSSFACKKLPLNRAPATTALGRPMRKSASKFSAVKLLKAGLSTIDDESSNEDSDWHPSATEKKDSANDHTLIGTKQKEKPKAVVSEKIKRPSSPQSTDESSTSSTDPGLRDNREYSVTNEPPRCKKRRIFPPLLPYRRKRSKDPASGADRPRLKLSNVSMTTEELNSRMSQQNDRKQLEDLGTEARLHRIDIAIKTSLIRGQEDIPACLHRLEALEKMELTLPILVKCSVIVDTIRKCSRYKPSIDVRIAALKVFNRFLKIRENASKEEIEDVHTEMIANNKKLSTSNAPSGPSSVADIFQDVQQLQASTIQQKPTVPQTNSSQSAKLSMPTSPAPPPPSASPPTVLQLPRTAPSHSPADRPPVATEDTSDSPSPSGASDSEGLAPSLGDLEGEESMESDEGSLPFHPSNSLFKSLNAEATVAAVKQVFLQRTRDKMAAVISTTEQSALPPIQQPPPAVVSEAEAYVPQLLHPCSDPLPTYVPISTFPPTSIPPSSPCPSSLIGELNRQLPLPIQEEGVQQIDPRLSPENRRRPVRERARSPHALPHPLEHYQRFLHNGKTHLPPLSRPSPPPASSQVPTRAATDDLDARIARLLEAAAPHPNKLQELKISSSPPPPPPPLPPSQNLILSHRPQSSLPPMADPSDYTPASPVADETSNDQYFNPLKIWPLQQRNGSDDMYKNMDI